MTVHEIKEIARNMDINVYIDALYEFAIDSSFNFSASLRHSDNLDRIVTVICTKSESNIRFCAEFLERDDCRPCIITAMDDEDCRRRIDLDWTSTDELITAVLACIGTFFNKITI